MPAGAFHATVGGILLALLPGLAAAQGVTPQPLWEFGLVSAVAMVPDYPGADRNQLRALPLPYAIYRGRTLRAEGGGVRGRYRFTPDTELDLSFGGALPVGAGNPARKGMPNLDLLLEIGPRLMLTFARPRTDAAWSVVLPVRAVFSTDFTGIDLRGFITTPELAYADRQLAGSAWRARFAAGPMFASEGLNDYFYEVAPRFALADRPAYNSRRGYVESRATANFSRAFSESWTLFTFARLSSLHGASNEDSPLLREKINWAGGLGLAWTFRRSTETAASEE